MPPRRFVLHLGMPKTGSTAIQDTLAAREEVLTGRRVLYPHTARRGSAHHRLAWSASLGRVPRDGELPLPELLSQLEVEIASAAPEVVVLSTEALFHTPAGELRPVVGFCDSAGGSVSVIVYVRSPWEYHEGWYRQRVKTSDYPATFPEHLATAHTVDIGRRLADIEGVVGRDRVHVRPYDRALLDRGDVVQDFLSAANLEPLESASGHSNPSLGARATRTKQRLNAAGIPHDLRVARALAGLDRGDQSLFTREAWSAFQGDQERILTELAARPGFPADFGRKPPKAFADDAGDDGVDDILAELAERFPGLVVGSGGDS